MMFGSWKEFMMLTSSGRSEVSFFIRNTFSTTKVTVGTWKASVTSEKMSASHSHNHLILSHEGPLTGVAGLPALLHDPILVDMARTEFTMGKF